MTIRQGRADDARSLVILLEQLGHPLSEEIVLQKIKLFTKEDFRLLVCEVDREVVGFISLHCFDKFHSEGMTARITALCVHEKVRDMGIGGALLAAAEKYLTDNGCREIEVTTNMRRALTPDFYRKHGYAEHSRHFIKSLR
ncbi:GNAT family N-acetyltransferase [Chryseolinea sp. T2]|uniref:GNAT family N-acetyltransferase n=1 Tax=Chryseolinea sp. T2 TaxID=3129255 RepID=UPI00307876F1